MSETHTKKKGKKGENQFQDASKPKFVNKTPKGEMKDFKIPMANSYQPQEVEASWDAWWEKQGLYKADNQSDKEKFVIVIPPPNVTGRLHIGHALTGAIEDSIVRWHRMSGKEVLWVPGTDHAGIATQVVVEKKLWKEQKKTRHDLGREDFIKEVWKWKESNGNAICNQIRRLGLSVDWSREAFTMDSNLTRAVITAFCRMHAKGKIYRANRLVNWSCALRTAISSIEVDHIELEGAKKIKVPGYDEPVEFGIIVSFSYQVEGTDEYITVSTTRLETMLGDVAVAVHPDDDRYKKFHGKKLVHPFIKEREIVVICDAELAKMDIGTGAVKVTPAHDPKDFQCGQRNNLPSFNIFDDDGNINKNGGEYKGMPRYTARVEIQKALEKLGLYKGTKDNPMSLGICSRSKDIVEPVLRPQWWVDCKEMAQRSVDVVNNKELEIIPEFHKKTWFHWLGDIQDWCISRQLWWGHRIPAYLVKIEGQPKPDDCDMNNWVVAASLEEAREIALDRFKDFSADKITLEQDPDVLDTWFSSGLFPFSVMGWPDDTDDLKAFYPGHMLETGWDILFFWVARMVMMGLELTDRLPFTKVYLHSMVRDKYGRKMSKSKGNVLDPIDVMEGVSLERLLEKLHAGNLDPAEVKFAEKAQKADFPGGIAECGADALRFGLLGETLQGKDINLDIQKVVKFRQFCNKLWNATKFGLLNFPENYVVPDMSDLRGITAQLDKACSQADRWILSRLSYTAEMCNKQFGAYEFAAVVRSLRSFWLEDLCDVYLELIKPLMYEKENPNVEGQTTARAVLYTCMNNGLRMMHPLMPFVTEELYHRLPGNKDVLGTAPEGACDSIMIQPYPKATGELGSWRDTKCEVLMALMQKVSKTSRSLREQLKLTKERKPVFLVLKDAELMDACKPWINDIAIMASASNVTLLSRDGAEKPPEDSLVEAVNTDVSFYLPVKGIDVSDVVVRMEQEFEKENNQLKNLKKTMSNDNYIKKAKEQQKIKDEKQMAQSASKVAALQGTITKYLSYLELEPKFMTNYYNGKIKGVQAKKNKLEKQTIKTKKNLPSEKDWEKVKDNEKKKKKLEAKQAKFLKSIEDNADKVAELEHVLKDLEAKRDEWLAKAN